MRWLIVLALVGCANKADLYEAARACGTVSECPEEWEAWDKASKSKRKAKEERTCPPDMVLFSDGRGSECVSRDEMNRLLESLRF